MANEQVLFEKDYGTFFLEVKSKIASTRIKVSLSVNRELVKLYWDIGQRIREKEEVNGWGTKVIERLALDLKSEFPLLGGFSRRNLFSMRRFAEAYSLVVTDSLFTLIPWGHNIVLLEKLETLEQRSRYARKTIQNGWSRSMLVLWIESNLYSREGKAISNFDRALPHPESDVARELLKDP